MLYSPWFLLTNLIPVKKKFAITSCVFVNNHKLYSPLPAAYSNRVVQFLRQPNIYDLLRSRYEEPLSLNLRTAIEDIRETGAPELERMQQLVDNLYLELTIILR